MVAVPAVAMAASPDPVRVLLIDDSVVTRVVVARVVDAMAGHVVHAAVSSVEAALALLAHNAVDLILLDLNLPGMDGLSGLPVLAKAAPASRIMVLSSDCIDGSPAALHARSLGAVATFAKPASAAMAGRFADELTAAIHRAMQPGEDASAVGDAFDVVAIGASTGGIHALPPLLDAIPAAFDVPILITQHLPESFTPYFAKQLERLAARPVDVARDGLRLRRGRVILAPGDAHMRVVQAPDGAAIRLDRTPSATGCMPSVDPMFESIARLFGPQALGIVLSGMGRDGLQGAGAIRAAGGVVAAQDQATSVVWGMPRAVTEAGLTLVIGTPEQLGQFIARGQRPA